jgi:flagellar biosynthesis protein FlhF
MELQGDPVAMAMLTHRTYQAPTMAAALAQVKSELGRDAVILRTRSFRKGGFFGLGGRPMWEVVASSHADLPPRGRYESDVQIEDDADVEPSLHRDLDLGASIEIPPRSRLLGAVDDTMEEVAPQPADIPQAPAPQGPATAELAAQIAQLKSMVESLASRSADAPCHIGELRPIHAHLLAHDVAPELAASICSRLRDEMTGAQLADPQCVREAFVNLLAARIRVGGPIAQSTEGGRARVVALIGPTGVGKTTTVAKLAANLKLRERRRVGLITIDTYRIAAVDQLRTYADIIEVPLRAVLTAGELAQAVHAMRDLDVILIDTVGRSQNDPLRLNQLRSFLAAADADEVHMVVAATSNRRCAQKVLNQFGPLGANRIILTKLDEAETDGMILNLSTEESAALSYVTTGQDVPDDIEQADAGRLAQRIAGGLYAR